MSKIKNIIIPIVILIVVLVFVLASLELSQKERIALNLNLNQDLYNVNSSQNLNQSAGINKLPDVKSWQLAIFPKDYHHDLDIYYPNTWQFSSGGDTDDFSRFWIQPFTDIDLEKQPHITITDFGMYGCPKTNPECSIDQVVPKTPQEIFNEKLALINNYKPIQLKNFNTNIIKYEDIDFLEQVSARQYLINTGKGVSLVSFFQFDELGEDFINEFLKKLEIAR
jgi:hypothetical protein